MKEQQAQGTHAAAGAASADLPAPVAGSLEKVAAATHMGLWEWDLLTDKVIYSEQWAYLLGYKDGEMPQSVVSWQTAVLPEDLEKTETAREDYLTGKTGKDYYIAEYRMLRNDGEIIWVQDQGTIVKRDEAGKPLCLMGAMQDITKLKKAESDANDQSRMLDFVARLSRLGYWDWDVLSGSIQYSDTFLDMLGYRPGEVGDSFQEWALLHHPDDWERINQVVMEMLNGKLDSYQHEVRMHHKDGGDIWTLDSGMVLERDEDNSPTRIIGGYLDIDKLKKDEERLQQLLEKNEQFNDRLQVEVKRAVKELESSRALTQTMFEANPYINFLFDDKLQPMDCNPAAVEFLGFTNKQDALRQLGQLMLDSVPAYQPDGRPSIEARDRLNQVVQEGMIDFETELVVRGKRTPLRVILKKLNQEDSWVIAAYLVDLRMIKEAKGELENQDKLLREVNAVATYLMSSRPETFELSIWNSLKRMSQSIDTSRVYIWQNFEQGGKLYCEQLYEWSEDLEGNLEETPEPIGYTDMPTLRDNLPRGICVDGPVKNLTSGREKNYFSSRGAMSLLLIPIFIRGTFWGFIGFEDNRKERTFSKIEEKVLQSSGMLIVSAVLRNEINQNLIQAREDALASTQAKSDFLSRMSHELRTPMNAIIGMCAIARKTDDQSKVRYCLEKIDVASMQMMDIINDILDMSKIESNKFEIASVEFDFEKMLENVINAVQAKVAEKRQNFTVEFSELFTRYVVADEMRLTQVLNNLLGNAVKFTPEGGDIALRIRSIDKGRDNATLHVEVQDNGIGVAKDKQQKLFNSFEQGDGSSTRRFGGSGLGLSLCKKIVSMMGGDIWVESAPGEGSTFSFEVNIEWGRERETELLETEKTNEIHILVVDDSEDVRLYFQNILGSFSLDCDVAAGGDEAVKMAYKAREEGKPYGLVFIDWKMPERSGATVAKELKKILGDEAVMVLISVADLSEIESEEGRLEVNRFLPKPILPSMLYNTIVELTNYSPMTERAPGEELPEHDWSGKSILIAEDIEINREIILSILDDTGLTVDCAANGAEAVALYEKNWNKYCLILMDVQMPELDGIAATRQIRSSGYKNADVIPILAMTANALKEDVANCLAAGMNDHISKPIDVDELLDKMSYYLDEQPETEKES